MPDLRLAFRLYLRRETLENYERTNMWTLRVLYSPTSPLARLFLRNSRFANIEYA